MSTMTSRRSALIALGVLTLVWSYNWIVMKQVLRYSGPIEFSALRYAVGTVVLFGWLAFRGESLRPPPLGPILVIGLAQTMAFQALVQWALVAGGAGRTALLAYTMPFWVVLLAWLVLAERPAPRQWASLALALAGLVLVLEPWRGLGGMGSVALAIGGGFCWAIGVVATKRLFQRQRISAAALTAWQMLAGTIGLFMVMAFSHERPIEWTPYFIGALAYNGLLSSSIAWVLWSYIVDRLPARISGMTSLAVPIVGIAFAWLQLGERPSDVAIAGIVAIVAALALALGGNPGARERARPEA